MKFHLRLLFQGHFLCFCRLVRSFEYFSSHTLPAKKYEGQNKYPTTSHQLSQVRREGLRVEIQLLDSKWYVYMNICKWLHTWQKLWDLLCPHLSPARYQFSLSSSSSMTAFLGLDPPKCEEEEDWSGNLAGVGTPLNLVNFL